MDTVKNTINILNVFSSVDDILYLVDKIFYLDFVILHKKSI